MAAFLLGSLPAEGPTCKTCEGLCNISLPLDLGTDDVNFLNLLNQLFWSLTLCNSAVAQ